MSGLLVKKSLGVILFSFAFATGILSSEGVQETNAQKVVPVVLVHGLGGSNIRARKDKADDSRGFTEDGFPQDLLRFGLGDPQNLQFDSSGRPRTDTISSSLEAVSFLKIPLIKDIADLSEHLQKEEYKLNVTLFEFYYDFRFSVPTNARKLGLFVERIKRSQKVSKVDIVGHSMGGLIAKVYAGVPANSRNVRRLIFVGTPHLGAPKALKALRYGDNLGIPIIDECKLKRVARNLPGLYNMLPAKKYFDVKPGYFYDDDDIDGDSVKGLLGLGETFYNLKNGKETRCLLKKDVDVAPYDRRMPLNHLNKSLIDTHTLRFHALFDNWKNPRNVEVYNVVGFGEFTVESIRERDSEVVLIETREGDGTVPLWSAESVESDHVYYVNLPEIDSNHATMIGNKRIREQIHGLLTRGAGVYIPNIVKNRPDPGEFEKRSKEIKN